MNPEVGQIWKTKKLNRSDIEIVYVEVAFNIVKWKYIDSNNVYDMKLDIFINGFELKKQL